MGTVAAALTLLGLSGAIWWLGDRALGGNPLDGKAPTEAEDRPTIIACLLDAGATQQAEFASFVESLAPGRFLVGRQADLRAARLAPDIILRQAQCPDGNTFDLALTQSARSIYGDALADPLCLPWPTDTARTELPRLCCSRW